MENKKLRYPFTAVVGQDQMKLALILNLINPKIGGVLIFGEKGTAKSTIVRSMENLVFGRKVVELPLSTTEDKVIGSIDVEHAIQTGETRFEPGILYRADGHILYVDEVNLLEDHLVDVLLDVSAMGVNYVEREGISHTHPSRFVLVGTMNPEEGDLRPQLLDRFGLSVEVHGESTKEARTEILKRRLQFEQSPEKFIKDFEHDEKQLADKVSHAKQILDEIKYSDEILDLIAAIGIKLEVDGHRADITLLKTALALAAYEGDESIQKQHIYKAAELVLPHRLKRRPFEDRQFDGSEIIRLMEK